MNRKRLVLGALWATFWMAWTSGWSEQAIYEHGTVAEATQGRIVIDRRYEIGVEVPVVDCPGEPFSCLEDRPFSVAYRLRMERVKIETRQGAFNESVEPAGTIWVAADLSESEEAAFESKLRETVDNLRGEAFGMTYAGMLGEEPFHETSLVGKAEKDAWICAADKNNSFARRHFVVRGASGEHLGFHSLARPEYGPVCEGLVAAFSGTGPEPDTDKRRHPVFSVSPDRVAFSTETLGTWFDLEYAPTEIAIPTRGDALWVSRWRLLRKEQRFGSYSTISESGFEFWLAALPIEDPLNPDAPPTAADINWRAKLAYAFKKMAALEEQTVIDAVSRVALSPSRDWIVVLCDDQGRATYSLLIEYRVEVSNGEELCGYLKEQLPAPEILEATIRR